MSTHVHTYLTDGFHRNGAIPALIDELGYARTGPPRVQFPQNPCVPEARGRGAHPFGGEGDAAEGIIRVQNAEHDAAGTLAEDVNYVEIFPLVLVLQVPRGDDDGERDIRLMRREKVHKGESSVENEQGGI